MGKQYTEITLRDGRIARDYGDGIPRNERGHIIQKQENAPVITHENARIYHAMRKAKILAAIESRVQDVTKTNAPADAIAAIVAKRATVAMNDDTRTGNEAAKIVLSALDAYQEKRSADEPTTIRNEYAMDADTLQLLRDMIQERREYRTDVLDADAENIGE